MNSHVLGLRAGEMVEVRSEAEILSTLESDGTLEGMSFMPEMRPFLGKRVRVFKRADKICVEGRYVSQMENAVFLEDVRCDGAAHDACKRLCLIFWKEAWLKRSSATEPDAPSAPTNTAPGDTAPRLVRGKVYYCQSTNVPKATRHLPSWDLRQYVRDYASGNFTLSQIAKALFIDMYNRVMRFTGGGEFGSEVGKGKSTPAISLNLQPGELVEVKTREEIAATLDTEGRNKGLHIDHEQLRHGGRRFRVLTRVDRIILETTGEMKEIRDTVILEGGACEGLCRRACSRNSYPMWREAWLKRVKEPEENVPVSGKR
jgi:hypothetical protein